MPPKISWEALPSGNRQYQIAGYGMHSPMDVTGLMFVRPALSHPMKLNKNAKIMAGFGNSSAIHCEGWMPHQGV